MKMKLKFTIKDKTGRGYSCEMTKTKLIAAFGKEVGWSGETVRSWAKDAGPGDEWKSASMEIECSAAGLPQFIVSYKQNEGSVPGGFYKVIAADEKAAIEKAKRNFLEDFQCTTTGKHIFYLEK